MQKKTDVSSIFATVVIPATVVVAILIYMFVLGNPANFIENDNTKEPKTIEAVGTLNHYLAVFYKGGFVVPILISFLLMVITFSIERFLTITKAKGSGNVANFVKKVSGMLKAGDVNGAMAECDRQKGSVANVIKSGLVKYKEMEGNSQMSKDQKILAIQQEVEESTSLELPMLQKNLPVIATLAPIGTLVGLFGTVLGMIRAFSALAATGAPDSSALSTGISEALINTALGIGTSALAIILYNVFTTQIDSLTYSIDEAGYVISQTFDTKH